MKRVNGVPAAILLVLLVWESPVLHRKLITEPNEIAVVNHLRAVIVAQNEYAKLSGGLYGNLECLAHPGNCLPVDASDSEPLLDASVALAELRGGYRFVFLPGQTLTRDQWKAEVKRSAEGRRWANLPMLDPDHL